jgi:hypothetical protein
MFMGITYNPSYSRQHGEFLGGALRVTSGHQYAAIRIHPLQSAYRCSRVFVRVCSHGTGIQYDNSGVDGRRGALQPSIEKLPFQRGAVRLCGAAAKILYVEARHTPILNQVSVGTGVQSIPRDMPHLETCQSFSRGIASAVIKKLCP